MKSYTEREFEQAEQNELLVKGGLFILAIMALFAGALFLISPGAFIIMHTLRTIKHDAGAVEHWIYSSAASLLILLAIHFTSNKTARTVAIYLATCAGTTAIAYNSNIDGIRTVDYAISVFSPFHTKKEVTPSIEVSRPLVAQHPKIVPDDEVRSSPATSFTHSTQASPATPKQTLVERPEETKNAPEIEASFDCKMARNSIEIMICSDPAIAELDKRLDTAYKSAFSKSKNPLDIKRAQIYWIKNVARPCQNKQCLEEAYKSRISELDEM